MVSGENPVAMVDGVEVYTLEVKGKRDPVENMRPFIEEYRIENDLDWGEYEVLFSVLKSRETVVPCPMIVTEDGPEEDAEKVLEFLKWSMENQQERFLGGDHPKAEEFYETAVDLLEDGGRELDLYGNWNAMKVEGFGGGDEIYRGDYVGRNGGDPTEEELRFLHQLEMVEDLWVSRQLVSRGQMNKIKQLLEANDIDADVESDREDFDTYSLMIHLSD